MTEPDDRHENHEPETNATPGEQALPEGPLATRAKGPKPDLPVIVLRDMVVYPGVTMPMEIGRADTLSAIQAAAEHPERTFFALLQREKSEEVDPLGLHTIGVVARVVQLQHGLRGTQAVVVGLHRGIVLRIDESDEHLVATVSPAEELLPVDPKDLAFVALDEELRNRAAELGARSGIPNDVITKTLRAVPDSGRLADLVAGHLELPANDHQSLLETLAVEERMRRVLTLVQRRIKVLDAQEDINTQVQEELGDRQREMYLREQLKAIRKELGDDDGADDLEELRARVDDLELPAAARKEVEREFRRLERMGRESMESQVIRTYIETMCELPWSELSEERLDLDDAAHILDEDHYGLDDVKDRILEFLAVRVMHDRRARREEPEVEGETEAAERTPAGAGGDLPAASGGSGSEDPRTNRSPILLFAGPPGVGKTSIAKSIARAMGREYVRVSLGGARDEADIRGHRRTYVGSMPGRILHGMKQAGVKNPVFLLDEVDKLGASLQGDPSAALLEVLDPAQNSAFIDHYLGVPYDLSQVLFIATANFIQNIPAPLRDRMETVEFSGYTEREKLGIASQFLLPRAVRNGGLSPDQIDVGDEALGEVISRYTHEAGVRQLERELGRMVRKVARKLASTPEEPGDGSEEAAEQVATTNVGAAEVREFLGRPRVRPERALERDAVGVATGMYYTPVGGDIMFVEVETTSGKGELQLTGQLGDVMKESARAAWTYAKSNAEALRIPPGSFETDVHVHVPAGAIPKDGPSAGVTMAAALVSALSGRPAKARIAMTGEITLSGRVLPIGGVKEKVLGAVRAGIREIVLPKQNEADLEDLPADVLETLTVHAVEQLGEVLAVALPSARFVDGRLLFEGDDPEDVRPLSYN
ncbi:MAG: endopeptidase La [Holophagales bacterium]|nr:endopeptidase La [Holophagales bacterium]MYD21912.1 endopeptidase La [Holophagales bacterium]MYI31891.1 endopeptidase La [Holophagales bacterium]